MTFIKKQEPLTVAHIGSIRLHVGFRKIFVKLGVWVRIEEETSRTLKRYLTGRRVLDVKGPGGTGLSAAAWSTAPSGP